MEAVGLLLVSAMDAGQAQVEVADRVVRETRKAREASHECFEGENFTE